MGNTKIEWCDKVWNPIRGCSRVSEGCRFCYAERVAARFSRPDRWALNTPVIVEKGLPFKGLAKMTKDGPRWTGEVRFIEKHLEDPLHWKKPCRIFTASMSDPFHDKVLETDLDKILAVMALCQHHIFQTLTKRPQRMLSYLSDPNTPNRILRSIDKIMVDRRMNGIKESWKPVKFYEGHYEVSNYGRVRSLKRKESEILKQAEHSGGYRQVALCKDGEPKTILVHHLVLSSFVGHPSDGDEARHQNGNRADNRIENLSWGTKSDNMQDSAGHGTAGVWMKGRATLSQEQVKEIRNRRANGEHLDDIAKDYGSNRQQVSAICLEKIFKPSKLQWPLPNCWWGVSVEDQKTADERIPPLLQTPATVRFISYEPALGAVDLKKFLVEKSIRDGYDRLLKTMPSLDWVICGGESGPGARPFDIQWARDVVKQCKEANVACFVKQLGSNIHADRWPLKLFKIKDRKGGDMSEWPEDLRVREFPARAKRFENDKEEK